MLNIMCTVEEHATWTITSAAHRFIQMSGVEHENLVEVSLWTFANKKCWFLYIHLIDGSHYPDQTGLCFTDTLNLIVVTET